MVKKLSALAVAGLLALPAAALAGGTSPSVADLERKMQAMTQELNQLKNQVSELKARKPMTGDKQEIDALKGQMTGLKEDTASARETMEERAESWDMASRFKLYGDFRSRVDYVKADTPEHYSALAVAKGVNWFIDPTSAITPDGTTETTNVHTVSGSMGSTYGTAGLLYGFFVQDPSSPTYNDPTASAGAAGQTLGQILNGDSSSVTISIDGSGNITDVDDTGTGLPAQDKTANLVDVMKSFTAAQRAALFQNMGYNTKPAATYENDTMLTNRFRLNLQVKAMENVAFKGRMVMYKAWGMQNNPVDAALRGGPFMLSSLAFDGSRTRQPDSNTLYLDRAYVNWSNIGDLPMWFSIGRRPTSGGPPGQLRQGIDQRMATPTAYMDYPFDGLTLGYAYFNPFPGRIRFCYGRGFESGPDTNNSGLEDVDFAGISWDVYNKGDRFLTVQSFGAFNMFNVPDNIEFPHPIEFAGWLNGDAYNPLDPNHNNLLDRANLGNIYHTTGTYMAKVDNLHYFLAMGWSHTDPTGWDELGTSLLTSWGDKLEEKDGYSVYAGIRYDLPDSGLKLGLEYNWGSENWISFTPGHDDIYASKLAVRGHAAEAYLIWNLPAGEAISKYAKAFVRLGYQHHWYDYTGSGFWLGEPVKIKDLKSDPLAAQFYTPIEDLDQVYLSLDVYF